MSSSVTKTLKNWRMGWRARSVRALRRPSSRGSPTGGSRRTKGNKSPGLIPALPPSLHHPKQSKHKGKSLWNVQRYSIMCVRVSGDGPRRCSVVPVTAQGAMAMNQNTSSTLDWVISRGLPTLIFCDPLNVPQPLPKPTPPGSLPTPRHSQLSQIYPKILNVALPSGDTLSVSASAHSVGTARSCFSTCTRPDDLTLTTPPGTKRNSDLYISSSISIHIHNLGTAQNSLSATCCWCCPSVVSTALFSKPNLTMFPSNPNIPSDAAQEKRKPIYFPWVSSYWPDLWALENESLWTLVNYHCCT